ncbi:hypothetical protein BCV70DRAFT_199308 [Testicularia cyperi]|uniref:Zn(2)-C6 fungal-type domain-containing protein n=1 Tax=Testicularia cyperi TaxID=1882483 RepID=A0A317XU92_9BASI|nr:hypothetical protein BCV70DRAFT_199308 [Testicularia cyperi]
MQPSESKHASPHSFGTHATQDRSSSSRSSSSNRNPSKNQINSTSSPFSDEHARSYAQGSEIHSSAYVPGYPASTTTVAAPAATSAKSRSQTHSSAHTPSRRPPPPVASGARGNGAYSPVRDSQTTMSDSYHSNRSLSPADGPSSLQDNDPASSSAKKEFQRSFKACDGCRTKKVKCELGDLAAPSEPPCARCKREMRPCLFTMSTRGRGPKARSSRSHAFGAHHLAKNPNTSSVQPDDDDDDDLDPSDILNSNASGSGAVGGGASGRIDALAGAALASLSDPNPRLHSTRNDVPVSALDPSDAPSIGMIYGLNRQDPTASHSRGGPRHQYQNQPHTSQHNYPQRYSQQQPSPQQQQQQQQHLQQQQQQQYEQEHQHKRRRLSSFTTAAEDASPGHINTSDQRRRPDADYPRLMQLQGQTDNSGPSSANRTRSTSPAPATAGQAAAIDARPDTLQQYAEVGLQHSKDALRVLAGVAVDSRQATDDIDGSRDGSLDNDSAARDAKGNASTDPSAAAGTDGVSMHPGSSRRAGESAPTAASAAAAAAARRSAAALVSRPITPPPLKHNYGWSKFEPIRLKLIKRSEARYFLNFFVRQMHSFAPHCSPHLLDKSPEALSELVCREPILLGAMLSVASRYDVANHNAHVTAVDTFHRKISKWTQEKISRSFFLPASHTIGTIEALLILSEWATLDLHDRRTSPDASSESEDEDDDNGDGAGGAILDEDSDDDFGGATAGGSGVKDRARDRDRDHAHEHDREGDRERGPTRDDASSNTSPAAATGDDLRSEHEGQIPRPRGPSQSRPLQAKPSSTRKPRQADMRESEKFDDTAWMLTGTALRLAERLDLHNDATYSGISSRNVASRRNAERRMRVWMSSVHADCHLSVRLGRRISSPGLAAPFMNLVRDRTHPFLLNADMSAATATNPASSTSANAPSIGGSSFPSGSNRAWIAFRAHSELLQIVFRTCENLYRSKAVTERLLEDEDFVPALKSIRDDLDNWANWTQPRIEPTRDMTSLRVRVEYHYARLYANGIALDSVKRSLTTLRNHRQYRASEAAEIGSRGRLGKSLSGSGGAGYTVSFSTHPAYPFVREALAAAQSLIRILTVELESMMCAPARWFLLLVMAAVFCVKATAVSDAILPLKRCAQSLQQVITALGKAAPDGVHLANKYSMYLRQLAKQLVLTDAKTRGAGVRNQSPRTKPQAGNVGASTGSNLAVGGPGNGNSGQPVVSNVGAGREAQFDGSAHAADSGPGIGAAPNGPGNGAGMSGTGVADTTMMGAPGATAQHQALAGVPSNTYSQQSPAASSFGGEGVSGSGSMGHMGMAGVQQAAMPWAALQAPAQVHPSSYPGPAAGLSQGTGSGSGWWSTADILPGEVDPQLFLKWLDDQTLATAPPSSHHPLTSWAADHGNGPSSAAGVTPQSRFAAGPGLAASPHGTAERSPSTDASNPQTQQQQQQGLATQSHAAGLHPFVAANVHHPQHHPGGSNGGQHNAGHGNPALVASGTHAGIGPMGSSRQMHSNSVGQDDLLTRMWLDDALTDLAAAGLDMPFL